MFLQSIVPLTKLTYSIKSEGMDVGKRKCRVTIKDRTGQILNDFFFSNDKNSFLAMIRMA